MLFIRANTKTPPVGLKPISIPRPADPTLEDIDEKPVMSSPTDIRAFARATGGRVIVKPKPNGDTA